MLAGKLVAIVNSYVISGVRCVDVTRVGLSTYWEIVSFSQCVLKLSAVDKIALV